MPVWIGVYLRHLALDVFRPVWASERPATDDVGSAACKRVGLVVLEQERVLHASADAWQAGIRPGMRRASALILHPEADCRLRALDLEEAARERVAMALLQFSPQVALLDDALILIEVSASLRLFGGIRALRHKIRQTVITCGLTARIGMAPTGMGASLLARAGVGHALRLKAKPESKTASPRSLERTLDRLPLALLPSTLPFTDWFTGLGCRTLGDLRRLPRAGLKQRCGSEVLDRLDQARGLASETFIWVSVPDHFEARQELPDHINQSDAVLGCAAGLLAQLCGWLVVRQLAVTRLVVWLEHERGRHAVAPTQIEITLTEPTWTDQHAKRLLNERLTHATPSDGSHDGNGNITSSVKAIRLAAPSPVPARPPSGDLFPEPGGSVGDHARLIELLCARLGAHNVQLSALREDHRPEYANHWDAAHTGAIRAITRHLAQHRTPQRTSRHSTLQSKMRRRSPALPTASGIIALPPKPPRPVWLLQTPLPLLTRQHRPFYGTLLRLISPAERIESGWWDIVSPSAMRDYFVAEAIDHSCYWIFRERLGDGDSEEVRWFLHGLFG